MDLYAAGRIGVSAPFPEASGGWAGQRAGRRRLRGGAVVQTQECTHVSEQPLAVEEGAPPGRAGRRVCVRTWMLLGRCGAEETQ